MHTIKTAFLVSGILTLWLAAARGQSANFVLASTPVVGNGPDAVAVADVNGDGKPDLIAASYGSKSLTVLLNNGGGIFTSNTSYATPVGSTCLVAADVNGDGKLDLIYASSDNNTLTVLTNNGSGVFGSNAVYTLPGSPYNFAAADVNGDGKVDLIAADYNAYEITVLTNNGAGKFVSSGNFGCGSQYPRWIAVADFNGDGRPDVAVADYYSPHTLAIMSNNGNGTFTQTASTSVGGWAFADATADVNGDGKPDLISSGGGGGNVLSVCTNNGSGGFPSVANYTVGSSPVCIGIGDLNGDGKPDLVSVNSGDNTLTILTNNGTGLFFVGATNAVGNAPNFVAVADVNGDGKPDLICVNNGTNTLSVLTNAGAWYPVSLTSIEVAPANDVIAAGSNLQYTATEHFSDGSSLMVTNGGSAFWASSNPTVASISTNGVATGLTNGVTTILATGGISGSNSLTVVIPPVVSTQPTNTTASPNGAVTFTVSATGGDLSYQWQLNGTNITGATGATLTLTNLSADQAGVYSVIVSNAAGVATNVIDTLSFLNINVYAGLTIVGQVGGNYEIDYWNDLSSSYTVLANIVLPSSPYLFIDTNSPNFTKRFYRAVLLP